MTPSLTHRLANARIFSTERTVSGIVVAALAVVLSVGCGTDATSMGSTQTLTANDTQITLEFATKADAVLVGRVTSIDHAVSQPDANGLQLPFTFVTWQVEDGIKGVQTGDVYTARFLGGPMGDQFLDVTEIPEFAVGDRDLVFVERNGVIGCPLVGGARGRVQLLDDDAQAHGLSPVAPDDAWAGAVASTIRSAGLQDGIANSVDPTAQFSFEWPKPVSAERIAAAADRARARIDAVPNTRIETADERQERLAVENNDFNPVLPR